MIALYQLGEIMKIKVRDVAEKYFAGDRNMAAQAAGVSLHFFNNWVSQDREVLRLQNGDFVLVSERTKIIKIPENNDCVI